MSKPITVLERKPVETELVEREYTYEELLELFPDGGESIVNPLVRRCQEYEAAIERLKKACELYRKASAQSHQGHWDPTRKGGAGCPECNRASQLRSDAEAALKEEDTHEMA